jgi:23S rRNA pseudouridine1911/1915/1917 synthase
MAMTTLSTTIDGNNAGRVDVVVRLLSESSHSQVRGMLDSGCVSINSTIILSGATTVVVGDLVSIRFDPTQGYREKKKCWDDRTFTVSFEDDHLIVVDKSAGTLTVPTARNERNTLVDRVSIYLGHSRSKREACLVHRLDRDVSGLVIFGKHKQVATRLIEQFKQQKPSRVYAAIVAGVVSTDKGSFHSHLATGKSLERYVTRPSPTTELAITHYRVIRRMSDTTLVEVTLETGKRNQIRVQFANAEHPVLGDPRYKTELAMHPRWIRKRIALHAKSLGFEHPISGDAMQIESPLPSAIEKFLAGSR